MDIRVSDDIRRACPHFVGAALICTVQNSLHHPGLWEQIARFEEKLLSDTSLSEVNQHPVIAATRQAYKVLGKDPNRYRPSAEALRRRLIRGLGLYQINTLVDLINVVSLVTGFSIGGFDYTRIEGALTLGVGRPGEHFEAIGRGVLNITGLPVYRDDNGGVGTPTSDEERTKILPETIKILIIINGYNGRSGLPEAIDLCSKLLTDYANAKDISSFYFS